MAVSEIQIVIHDDSYEFAHRVCRNQDSPDNSIQIDYAEFENGTPNWKQGVVVISVDGARKMAAALNTIADDIENNKWDF